MGLGAAQRTVAGLAGESAEGPDQCVDLDRIAKRRAGAMRLDVADLPRIDAEAPIQFADQPFLGLAVRCGDAVAGAVLVHARGADHPVDRIAIRDRVRQALEGHHADRFRQHDAVAAAVEGMAAPGGRQHLHLRQADQARLAEGGEYAAGEHQIRLAVAQALAGQVDGRRGRRAAGVHNQRRPLEIEEIGQPRGDDRIGGADEGFVEIAGRFRTDENPHRPVPQAFRVVAGILQRLPAFLEDQPLMRIHGFGIAGRDIEEQRIEIIPLFEDAAPSAVGLAGLALRGIAAPAVQVALAQFGDAVGPGAEVVPEAIDAVGRGKLSRHADHRDLDVFLCPPGAGRSVAVPAGRFLARCSLGTVGLQPLQPLPRLGRGDLAMLKPGDDGLKFLAAHACRVPAVARAPAVPTRPHGMIAGGGASCGESVGKIGRRTQHAAACFSRMAGFPPPERA